MNNYTEQKTANIQAFVFNTEEYGQKYKCLRKLTEAFDNAGVRWGLSCSAVLFFHGISDHFTDYDIVIDKHDIEKAIEILKEIATEEEAYSKPCFKSDYYGEVVLEGVELDVICVFGVNTFGAHYVYDFDIKYVNFVEIEEDFIVPLIPEEAQWVLYSMMMGWQPQRRFKRDLLTQYLKTTGIKHPEVFEEALNDQLPYWMKAEIKALQSGK